MKKIILLSTVALLSIVVFNSCTKTYSNNVDENYWLSQERGEVVYSDSYCNYFVVETYYGYTIVRANGNYRPYEGSTVYGSFGNYGLRNFYNYSSGVVFGGEVVEYDLSYVDAQYAVDYYCPYAKQAGKAIKASATKDKTATIKRVAAATK